MNKLISNSQLENNIIQMKLPLEVEIFIDPTDPVVSFKEVMEGVNLSKYLKNDSIETRGRDGYDPEVLLKIVLFAFMINVRSTRKIESLCRNDIRFMYLSDEIRPSHMTICNFINDYLVDNIENMLLYIAFKAYLHNMLVYNSTLYTLYTLYKYTSN